MSTLLSVENLTIDIQTERGTIPIIRDVSFEVAAGETLGIVGESGSGKTLSCLGLLKLIPTPPAIYRQGQVVFNGEDLWQLSEEKLREVRGRQISVIFQEALSALNPVMKVGTQVAEVMIHHLGFSTDAARAEVLRLFDRVGIADAADRFEQFPHQLSGGLQQRVMIAMALACKPALLIADEPTTALDVTIQVQILELLKSIQEETGMALIFISHDLGVIAEVCKRVQVMYAGQIVESAAIREIFNNPRHPYTRLLLDTIPDLQKLRGHYKPIPGQIPTPATLPDGCKFHPRCPQVMAVCRDEEPALVSPAESSKVRCYLHS